MHRKTDKKRRGALKAAARYSILALLGAVGYKMGVKKPVDNPSSVNACIADGICSRCGVYEKCGLPQALSRKKVLAGKNNSSK